MSGEPAGTVAVIANEALHLLPDRALFWPRRQLLLVADPHFGKADAFRANRVYVPQGTTESALARLDAVIARLAPGRLVFLGDFLHAREGRTADTFNSLAAWRRAHGDMQVQIVRGNHDRRAGDPPSYVGIECIDAPLLEPPFALAHHPVALSGSYVLCGHVHPCAVMVGPARQRERLPCFSFGTEVGILPAFGEFTGCAEVGREPGQSIWLVTDDEVVRASESNRD